jgi:hypothetical protein
MAVLVLICALFFMLADEKVATGVATAVVVALLLAVAVALPLALLSHYLTRTLSLLPFFDDYFKTI